MTSGFAGAEGMTEALGGLIWLELELFEVVGAWVSPAAEPALKELFATQCYHHVWRAELLRPRLHAFGGVEPVGRIVPPNDRGPEFLDHLCDERDAVLRLARIEDAATAARLGCGRRIAAFWRGARPYPMVRLFDWRKRRSTTLLLIGSRQSC